VINTIAKFTALNGSNSASANNQDFTHVLVTMDRAPASTDYLQVQFMPIRGKTVNIVNRIPLLALASISDINNGHSNALQAALNALTTTDYIGYAFAIPVGVLKLRAVPGTLEFSIETGSAADVSLACVNLGSSGRPDHWLEWKIINLMSGQVDRCAELYGYVATAVVDPSGSDLSFQVTTGKGQSIANAMDVFGATAVFGKIEAEAPRYAVSLFQCDQVEEAVSWNITGTTTGWFVVACCVGRDFDRVLAGNKLDETDLVRKIHGASMEAQRALGAGTATPVVFSGLNA